MFKKNQDKVVPQGLQNRVSAEPENAKKKEKEPPRPGSAISREFVPKKQQKAVNQWKKNDSQDSTNSQTQQSVNTPFGYVPFKSAPVPIYGNRVHPNGNQPNTQAAIANYMQNAYQQSPQLPRPDSVMTATDLNSRPGSELGLFRLPSRYQSYTTLPRPEQVPIETQPIQQPIYGAMIPKAHSRAPSMDRNSIYGTSEKRPLSQVSGSKSLHTIHTEPYIPRVGSKAALSYYGVPYPEEEYGPKSAINWDSLNVIGIFQILFAIIIFSVAVLRLFNTPNFTQLFEIAYPVLLLTNGVISILTSFQRNYSLFCVTFIFSTINFMLSVIPVYYGAEPFVNAPEAKVLTAFDAPLTQQNGSSKEMNFILFFVSLLAFFTCLVSIFACCKSMGKIFYYVENLRFQNDLNKRSKEIGSIVQA